MLRLPRDINYEEEEENFEFSEYVDQIVKKNSETPSSSAKITANQQKLKSFLASVYPNRKIKKQNQILPKNIDQIKKLPIKKSGSPLSDYLNHTRAKNNLSKISLCISPRNTIKEPEQVLQSILLSQKKPKIQEKYKVRVNFRSKTIESFQEPSVIQQRLSCFTEEVTKTKPINRFMNFLQNNESMQKYGRNNSSLLNPQKQGSRLRSISRSQTPIVQVKAVLHSIQMQGDDIPLPFSCKKLNSEFIRRKRKLKKTRIVF